MSHDHHDQIAFIGRDFIGKNGEENEEALKAAFPGLIVHVLPSDAVVTMDIRTDRIRVYCDENGNIEEIDNG